MLMAAVLLQASVFSGTISTKSPGYELSSLFYLTCVKHIPVRSDVTYEMKLPSYSFTDASAGELSGVIFRSDVTQSWSVTSKNGGRAVLWLAPKIRTCGVNVQAATTKDAETTFTELLNHYFQGQDFVITEQPKETSDPKDGTKFVLRSWIVRVAGRRILLQGSFADAPISGFQHKMTLTLSE
jgi:hypothetical protein